MQPLGTEVGSAAASLSGGTAPVVELVALVGVESEGDDSRRTPPSDQAPAVPEPTPQTNDDMLEKEIVDQLRKKGKAEADVLSALLQHSLLHEVVTELRNNQAGPTSRSGVITAAGSMGFGEKAAKFSAVNAAAARLGNIIGQALLDANYRRCGHEDGVNMYRTRRVQELRSSGGAPPAGEQYFSSLRELHDKGNASGSLATRAEDAEYRHSWVTIHDYVRNQLKLAGTQFMVAEKTRLEAEAALRARVEAEISPAEAEESIAALSSPPTVTSPQTDVSLPTGVHTVEPTDVSPPLDDTYIALPVPIAIGSNGPPAIYIWMFGGFMCSWVKVGCFNDFRLDAHIYRCSNTAGFEWLPDSLLVYPFSNIPESYSIRHIEILFAQLVRLMSYSYWGHGVSSTDPTARAEDEVILNRFQAMLSSATPQTSNARGTAAATAIAEFTAVQCNCAREMDLIAALLVDAASSPLPASSDAEISAASAASAASSMSVAADEIAAQSVAVSNALSLAADDDAASPAAAEAQLLSVELTHEGKNGVLVFDFYRSLLPLMFYF